MNIKIIFNEDFEIEVYNLEDSSPVKLSTGFGVQS